MTAPGARLVLEFVEPRIPGALSYEELDGRLIGPLELKGVRYEHEAVEVTWLDQGWTPDDWQWYYHASQGGSMELPIPYEWMIKLQADLVAKYYSNKEIKDLIKFYKSPLGKKLVKATPKITKDAADKTQARMMEKMPEIMKRMQQLMAPKK